MNRRRTPFGALMTLAGATVAAGLLLGLDTAAAQGKTQKLSKNLVKRAEDTLKTISDTEKQLGKVTERYGKLLSGKNVNARRKEHKRVASELKKLEDRAKDVRKRSQAMEREASKFFSEWQKGLDGIKDTELRALSRQSLTESQQGYGQVVAAGRSAADQYDAFVTTLGNQLKYLEVDMSDEAVAKLRSSGQDLRGEATELRTRVAGLKGEIDRYITALK